MIDIISFTNQNYVMDVQPILTTAAGLLFAGNIFFIKKLVDKVDNGHDSTKRMEQTINGFDSQLKDLKSDIKDLRRIEIEVAVLKDKFKRGSEE